MLTRPAVGGLANRPRNWNPAKPWQPTRFWGPFYEGSDLSQIKLVVGPTGSSVYFNDFFLTHENPRHYRQYFAAYGAANATSASLPNEPNTPPNRWAPGADTTNVIVFTLTEVAGSSAYGGSLRFRFVQQEEVGFEFAKQDPNTDHYFWDVSGMTADVFVKPNLTRFNQPSLRPAQYSTWGADRNRVTVDFAYGPHVMYQAVFQQGANRHNPWETVPPSAQAAVPVKLDDLINAITVDSGTFERLATGYIHTLFAGDVLSATDSLTLLPIEDGVIGPPTVTRALPYYSVEVQVTNLHAPDAVIQNTTVPYSSDWYWDSVSSSPGRAGNVRCHGEGGGTSWITVGTFLIDLNQPPDSYASYCDVFKRIKVHYKGVFWGEWGFFEGGAKCGIKLDLPHNGGLNNDDQASRGICHELRARAELTKTVSSVTRSGSTATAVTSAAHGLSTREVVAISGANQAEYNGSFTITVVDASTFTYTVPGAPATPATGTVIATRQPAPGVIRSITGAHAIIDDEIPRSYNYEYKYVLFYR
jgi:hypothetical protein